MTTLETINIFAELGLSGALENRIIHEYNNGGVKSAYVYLTYIVRLSLNGYSL